MRLLISWMNHSTCYVIAAVSPYTLSQSHHGLLEPLHAKPTSFDDPFVTIDSSLKSSLSVLCVSTVPFSLLLLTAALLSSLSLLIVSLGCTL